MRELAAPLRFVQGRGGLREGQRRGGQLLRSKERSSDGSEAGRDDYAGIDDQHALATLSRPNPGDDIGHRSACGGLLPRLRKQQRLGNDDVQQVGFLDDLLCPYPARGQTTGADPATDGFGIPVSPMGCLEYRQHML